MNGERADLEALLYTISKHNSKRFHNSNFEKLRLGEKPYIHLSALATREKRDRMLPLYKRVFKTIPDLQTFQSLAENAYGGYTKQVAGNYTRRRAAARIQGAARQLAERTKRTTTIPVRKRNLTVDRSSSRSAGRRSAGSRSAGSRSASRRSTNQSATRNGGHKPNHRQNEHLLRPVRDIQTLKTLLTTPY